MHAKQIIAATCLGLILVLVFFTKQQDPLHTEARRAWKNKSLAEISARLAQPDWATNQISHLKSIRSGDPDDWENWLSKELILLKSGEWLAFKNVCRKEKEHIHDCFLAQASDGQWYYSTYHFCVDMVSLKIEFQPENLASFKTNFCLRPFDGKSDLCLEQTWPQERR